MIRAVHAGCRGAALGLALLGLVAAASPSQVIGNKATNPLSREGTPWWHARHEEKLARIRQGHVDLVFLGDSIMQNWEQHGPPAWQDFAPSWERYYGDRNAVNLGFKGDTTASLIWRLEHGEVDGIHPKAAVILIGANNNGLMHASAAETLDGIAAVIALLHKKLPETKVILLSVLPSERSTWVDETTVAINRGLADRYGHAADVTYVDVTPLFYKDGRLDKAAFLDGYLTPPDPLLHPTAQQQARISAAIEPALARMMGDRNHDQR
jgi:lysophospholipase L1-like esterase